MPRVPSRIFVTLKAWWYPSDGDAYGNAALAPTATYTVALPQAPLFTTCPLQLQSEPVVQVHAESGQGQLAKHRGNDVGYVEPPRSLLAQAHIRTLLLIEGIYSFAYAGFDEVFTLWSLSTVGKGGLDWSTLQIGQVFLVCGPMVLAFEIFAVPNLTPRLGIRMSQRVGSVFEVPVYFLIPMLSRVNGHGLPVNAAALILLFTSYTASNSFYVGIALALNHATGPDRRGELNGISATVGSFARAISPSYARRCLPSPLMGTTPTPSTTI